MSANMLKIIKEANQDFEWYPTTEEMINSLINGLNVKYLTSVLDIGAGDGRVLDMLNNKISIDNLYSIEKSELLIQAMSKNILNIGRDFWETSLVEKQVDLIFCNPPYSEYENWMTRIIKEANFDTLAFIVPERWKENIFIQQAIQQRGLDYKIIDSFDFLNAERKARAKVDLIVFKPKPDDKDSFEFFLEERFGFTMPNDRFDKIEKEKKAVDELHSQCNIIKSEDLVDFLLNKYNEELKLYIDSIENLSKVNNSVLEYLDIDKSKVLKGLEARLKRIKAIYWDELFKKLSPISSKVISRIRSSLSSSVITKAHIEFNRGNIESVLCWFAKNINEHIELSYLNFFDRLSKENNAFLYKSNQRFDYGNWRYRKSEYDDTDEFKNIKLKLDYRIVVPYLAQVDHWRHNEQTNEFMQDLKVIANNLGFSFSCEFYFKFNAGESGSIYLDNGAKFFEYKAYKNGNVHFKFSQDFMAKFNLAVGRLRNWLTKEEAKEEFKDVSEDIIDEIFDKPLLLDFKNMKLLSF
ncbi:DUF4942 domain-containing protein [Campylobacter coli]|uniref:class I SAM-dependent methyltransferase n=2 Tax=Campylobacter coli TaxID=195 RepID=UPI000257CBBC|nr:DUF4942 domain-containing protein [Campylobacter coli]EAH6629755.1 DUF4942 domain-containing protein [Campylobacter jejuni]EIA74112.1 hypothetical protein cco5_07174 [Campylobacter coli 132-6]EIA83886.1 hypothetical protein cco7_08450 [Campylobacter coli 67-8]KDA32535.1 hypothetical protein N218_17810 [Campylobacter jejuni K5]HEE6703170.1 DUF4942 domain-containing protein [Campylobacter jejuni subsp. jejuni]